MGGHITAQMGCRDSVYVILFLRAPAFPSAHLEVLPWDRITGDSPVLRSYDLPMQAANMANTPREPTGGQQIRIAVGLASF